MRRAQLLAACRVDVLVEGRRLGNEAALVPEEDAYLVSWKGFPRDEATWEPMANLEGSAELISAYERTVNAS